MEDIRQRIKEAGIGLNTKAEESLIELHEKGYSRTGISKYNKSYKIKKKWTGSTALAASLLWPNLIEVGNDAKRGGYGGEFVKLTDKKQFVKNLIDSKIDIIDFESLIGRKIYSPIYAYSYCNKYSGKYNWEELCVTVKSNDKIVVDNSKKLATLVLERELGDIGPYLMIGNIRGRIRINNDIVEYSIYRELTLGVNNIIADILFTISENDHIKIVENIDEITLDKKFNVNKKRSWSLIHFKYKDDIIADEKVVNELKKLLFTKIQEAVKYQMSIFKDYNLYIEGKIDHCIRPFSWHSDYKLLKLIVTVNFEKNIRDAKYGVLFKL
jgi:hypothetical protein